MNAHREENITIRQACEEDAARITELATQLGYKTSIEKVKERLAISLKAKQQDVYVATLFDNKPIGWIHLYVYHTIVSDPQAMVGGIVVDQTYRGQGIGQQLMQQAEIWGREQSCEAVYLKSNIIRKDAHAFYQAIGYQHIKSQYAFRKAL